MVERRRIGSLEVSVVGLGCNNFGRRLDAARTADVIAAALDAGINFLDTSDTYGDTLSEEYIARALRDHHRSDVVLATKFGMARPAAGLAGGAKPDYVRSAVEASLRRLDTDHIDLYQLHRPDADTPIADTLGALDDLVRAGKVREIGCSNFSVAQMREAADAVDGGAARFISVQNEYSLLNREPETGVLDECARTGVAFIPYFPLASGLLTGKYRRGRPAPQGTRITDGSRKRNALTDENLDTVEALLALAGEHGHDLLELAFSWLLARPAVASVIAGATSAEQVRANAAAADWSLTPEELEAVDAIVPPPAAE